MNSVRKRVVGTVAALLVMVTLGLAATVVVPAAAPEPVHADFTSCVSREVNSVTYRQAGWFERQFVFNVSITLYCASGGD